MRPAPAVIHTHLLLRTYRGPSLRSAGLAGVGSKLPVWAAIVQGGFHAANGVGEARLQFLQNAQCNVVSSGNLGAWSVLQVPRASLMFGDWDRVHKGFRQVRQLELALYS